MSRCDYCFKSGTTKFCGRCKSSYYCNVECQRNDWKRHKKNCKQKQNKRANDLIQLRNRIPDAPSYESVDYKRDCDVSQSICSYMRTSFWYKSLDRAIKVEKLQLSKLVIEQQRGCGGTINNCKYTNRIIYALTFYQASAVARELFFESINYPSLLDDYIHIITTHNDSIQLEKIFEMMISKHNLKPCDIFTCPMAVSYHRDRVKDDQKQQNSIDNGLFNEILFYRDIMDGIHCYLYHLYDLGLRVKRKNRSIKYVNQDSCNIDFDTQFADIQRTVKEKTAKMRRTGINDNRYKISKYNLQVSENTFMDGLYQCLNSKNVGHNDILLLQSKLNHEEYDTDALTDDFSFNISFDGSNMSTIASNRHQYELIQEYIHHNLLTKHSFDIGYRFYYWEYYKYMDQTYQMTQQEDDNLNDHGGYSPRELFVSTKYESLKHEILNNRMYRLTIYQLNISMKKTDKFISTEKAKQTSSGNTFVKNDPLHYDIDNFSPIRYSHILSVILYTDWTQLSTELSKTFRKLNQYETIMQVTNRNKEYANWSKNIRELVEYYGHGGWIYSEDDKKNTENNRERGPFFCGMSFLMVTPQFNIRLNGPTSTTKRLAVATRFAGDYGIIMQLNNNGHNQSYVLKCWNCSWISNYVGEDEYLWCGGYYQIKIETIITIEDNQNYQQYFKPLFYFDSMLSGSEITDPDNSITQLDIITLNNLIKHELVENDFVNSYPKYVNATFHLFASSKTRIILRLGFIEFSVLSKIKSSLLGELTAQFDTDCNMSSNNDLGQCMKRIFTLFPNCNSIVIDTTGWSKNGYFSFVISISSLLSLHQQLLSLKDQKLKTTIRAHHNYKIEVDDESSTIRKYSYVSCSWLNESWKILKQKLNGNISFKTVTITNGYSNLETDVLEMFNDSSM
eukprot:506051_1